MLVNLPTFSTPPSLPSSLTGVSSLLSPAYPPPPWPLLSSPLLPASLSAVRGLISQVFLLRCDLLELFERWGQLPALDVSKLQQPPASPLLAKLLQKQQALEHSWHALQQLQRQAGLERMDRARRGGMRRQKTVMGYEGLMQHQQRQAEAAGGSNAALLRRLRAVHAAVRLSRRELHRSMQGLFPSLYQSLRTHPAAPPASSLQVVLDTALATAESTHPSAAAGGTWRGLQLQLETDDNDDVVGLIASLPLLLRVRIQLRRSALASLDTPLGPSSPASAFELSPQLSVSGWTEALLPPDSVSPLRVMSLVQAQLMAAVLQPQAASLDSGLMFLLFHISRYDSLFSSPCVACGRLLQLADDALHFVPPVIRTRREGLSLHIACAEGWRTAVPAQQQQTSSSSSSSPAAAAAAATPASAPAAMPLSATSAPAAPGTAAPGVRKAEQAV